MYKGVARTPICSSLITVAKSMISNPYFFLSSILELIDLTNKMALGSQITK